MSKQNNLHGRWFSSKTNIVSLVFLLVIGYFLMTEHLAHVIQALPYLLLLLCVGMHFFMHRGHNHSGQTPTSDDDPIDASKMRR